MSGTNGLTLAMKLKADSRLQSLPVIVMGPLGIRAQEQVLRERGIAEVVTKPLRAAKLYEAVQAALYPDRKRQAAAPIRST